MKSKTRKIRGLLPIVLGSAMLAAALMLAMNNELEQHQAGEATDEVMQLLREKLPPEEEWVDIPLSPGPKYAASLEPGEEQIYPDFLLNPEMPMPAVAVNEQRFVTTITIPALELSLPVAEEWSYPNLRRSPCRYSGSLYTDDMIICAHNYKRHFGSLAALSAGDRVILTDTDGNRFHYAVFETERLAGNELERLRAGEWDLTLFTCTPGGLRRVVVRLERVSPQPQQ